MAKISTYLKGGASTSTAPGGDDSWSNKEVGPFIGIVKGNVDPTMMGRLKVHIPALTKSTDPIRDNLFTCDYLAPFYGAKGSRYLQPDSKNYEGSQHSYGMWMVPPDLETKVLVIFAEGKSEQAYWIGCIQEPYVNHMVPGIASSEITRDKTNGGVDKLATYGSKNVPAGEVNRADPTAISAESFDRVPKPVHPFADVLLNQGLSNDDVRGNTSSTARRESPSNVFGISTPGRKDPGTTKRPIGTNDKPATDFVTRGPGHTFVLDDGDNAGLNQLIRMRSASGHQVLLHDTEGVVYIANGSGNSWIEMTNDGRIDVYSGVGGINLRTEGDFNLHSDANINFHANGQIRMNSEKEMIMSSDSMFKLGNQGVYTSAQNGSVMTFGKQGISSFTPAQQLHGSGGAFHLAGAQVHFNSIGASSSWGPQWLTEEKVGMASREEGDVELAKKGIEPLKSFTRTTKTTVHRFVTHEPMPRFTAFTAGGTLPTGGIDDKKMWSKLSNTPGTTEFLAQKNRLSDKESVRLGQYQADALEYVKQNMGNSKNVDKARNLLTKFASDYDKSFDIVNQAGGNFDIANSISNKLKNVDIGQAVGDVTKNFAKTISSQVIDNFSGKATTLFKDSVFVNKSGELFSIGKQLHGEFGQGINTANLLSGSISSVANLKGNLSIENIGSAVGNVSQVANLYKSITAGNVTGISSITSIAGKFGVGGSTARELAISGAPKSLINITSIATKVGGLFKSGGALASVGSFFSGFKFSDQRLKEDIRFIGKSPSGINIYSFKYKQLPGRYIGVMAQEVPWARHITDTGYYAVDYGKVDVEFRRLH